MRRVLNLKLTDILDYFCILFGALTPKTKKSDRGGPLPVVSSLFGVICCPIQQGGGMKVFPTITPPNSHFSQNFAIFHRPQLPKFQELEAGIEICFTCIMEVYLVKRARSSICTHQAQFWSNFRRSAVPDVCTYLGCVLRSENRARQVYNIFRSQLLTPKT